MLPNSETAHSNLNLDTSTFQKKKSFTLELNKKGLRSKIKEYSKKGGSHL